MNRFPLFALPRGIIDIICDYHVTFVSRLVDDAIAREDREACLFFKTHLPTYRFGIDELKALLDHCPTCESNLPLPTSFHLALGVYAMDPRTLQKCINRGCIHVMWLCIERGYFQTDSFHAMVMRLRLDADNLQKLFDSRVLMPCRLRKSLCYQKIAPWPELVKWFDTIGWRFSKRQRMQ